MAITPANYFSTLPLKKRFFFSIGVILSLLLLLSISSYLLQQTVIHAFEEARYEATEEMSAMSRLQALILQGAMPANDYLIHGSLVERQLATKFSAETEESFAKLLALDLAKIEERNLIVQAERQWRTAWQQAATLLAIPDPIGNREAARIMETFDQAVDQAIESLQKAHDIARQELNAELVHANQIRNRLLLIQATMLASGLALTMLIGSALTLSVLRPLSRLMTGAENFGQGDLEHRITLEGNDELAELGQVMNQMAIQLADHRRQLEELSRRDGLTGLYNKREFIRVLQEQVERNKRYGHPFHLVMLDLDHFKNVNDTYGHLAGDEVLKTVAGAIRREARTVDHAARYGGEEMVLILPETDLPGALLTAERVRSAVAALKIPVAASKDIGITVSLGVAGLPADAASGEELIAAADQALYAAKKAGRNRVLSAQKLAIPGG